MKLAACLNLMKSKKMNNDYTLVRHGQTYWNKNGIMHGQFDIPLNYTGIKQAKKIAIDLVKGDECKEELKITNNNISLLKEKLGVKDSIISAQKNQITNFGKMVEGKDNLLQISNENLSNAKKQISKYKATNLLWKGSTLLTIGVVGFLLLK